jgi:hypothetical protein
VWHGQLDAANWTRLDLISHRLHDHVCVVHEAHFVQAHAKFETRGPIPSKIDNLNNNNNNNKQGKKSIFGLNFISDSIKN